MAAYQDKVLVNDAITENTKMDLSHVHITSANFQELTPIFIKECVPGQTLKVGVESLARMNQLPVPTYGRANIKNSAYFVPFRTIFRGWNDFITDSPHANSSNNSELVGNILTQVPYVSNATLVRAFLPSSPVPVTYPTGMTGFGGVSYDVLGTTYAAMEQVTGDSIYDVTVVTGSTSATGVNFKFTFVGQQLLKVLESLGYKIQWNLNDNTQYSALPLLAYAKVYCDWYFPQDYTNTSIYNYLYMLCNADTGVALELNKVDVGRILQFVYTCYDSDYFVSAWDHPNSPNTGTYSGDFKISNIDTMKEFYGNGASTGVKFVYDEQGYVTNYADVATTGGSRVGVSDAPFISPSLLSTAANGSKYMINTPISEYLLHGLHALTDYMKRHQLASASFQRYLARFGKALSSEKMNRSIFLGTDVIPIQIGDVMSTSMVGASGFDGLGEYAGRGIAFGTAKDFEYSTDEYGMFIIVSSIQPATGYFQGIDRNVKHLTKLDYWTPEFDCLGVQPITADELYVSNNGLSDFGFNGSGKALHSQVNRKSQKSKFHPHATEKMLQHRQH